MSLLTPSGDRLCIAAFGLKSICARNNSVLYPCSDRYSMTSSARAKQSMSRGHINRQTWWPECGRPASVRRWGPADAGAPHTSALTEAAYTKYLTFPAACPNASGQPIDRKSPCVHLPTEGPNRDHWLGPPALRIGSMRYAPTRHARTKMGMTCRSRLRQIAAAAIGSARRRCCEQQSVSGAGLAARRGTHSKAATISTSRRFATLATRVNTWLR
jgi:hypothetical protein